jgi:hypothetical protein
LIQALHSSIQHLHRFGSEFLPGFLDESELFVNEIDSGEVVLVVKSEDLGVELGGLGEIEAFGVIDGGDITELLGEAERTEGVAEEVRGGVEVGELDRFGVNGVERIREVRASLAERGVEGGHGGAEGRECHIGVVERGELGEEVVVAGENLVTELRVEEADRRVEFLGGGCG